MSGDSGSSINEERFGVVCCDELMPWDVNENQTLLIFLDVRL